MTFHEYGSKAVLKEIEAVVCRKLDSSEEVLCAPSVKEFVEQIATEDNTKEIIAWAEKHCKGYSFDALAKLIASTHQACPGPSINPDPPHRSFYGCHFTHDGSRVYK